MNGVAYDFSSHDHPVLYRYTSISGASGIVSNDSFWLSDFGAMNDPSEFSFAREQLASLMLSGEIELGLVPRLAIATAIRRLRENTGHMIGSLTTRRDDLTQWRLYGNDGTGCVVGLDAAFLEHEAGVAIRTVQYEQATVRRSLLAGLSVVQDSSVEDPYDFERLMEFAQHLGVELFTIKHPAYADEREVRIMRMLIRGADTMVDPGGNRSGGGAVSPLPVLEREMPAGRIPYISLPLIREDGSSAIASIGFGPRATDEDFAEHAAVFQSRGIKIWRSQLPYR